MKEIGRNLESKERPDKLRVGISVAGRWGGFGDIEHGIKIARALTRDSSVDFRIYTPDFATGVINRVPSGMEIVKYKRKARPNHQIFYIGEVVPEDVMVSVCGAPLPSREVLPGWQVIIEEYSGQMGAIDLANRDIPISTGFQFDPNRKGTIQTGVSWSSEFGKILDTSRGVLGTRVEKSLSRLLGRPLKLRDSRVGVFYVGDFESHYEYFELLALAQPFIDRPVAIIAPLSDSNSDKGREARFGRHVVGLGFNYLSPSHIDNRGSKVTVFNPLSMPGDDFRSAVALADLPVVVTGDQSLTEALQKSQTRLAAPFLCYSQFGSKQADFLSLVGRIDRATERQLASYYLREQDTFHHIAHDAEGRDLRDVYSVGGDDIQRLTKLFYDPREMRRFNAVMSRIPRTMIELRKPCVTKPEVLADEGKTIRTVLEAIRTGRMEMIADLVVH